MGLLFGVQGTIVRFNFSSNYSHPCVGVWLRDDRIWSVCGLVSAFSAHFPSFHRRNTKKVKGSHPLQQKYLSSQNIHLNHLLQDNELLIDLWERRLHPLKKCNEICVFDSFISGSSIFSALSALWQMQISPILRTMEGRGRHGRWRNTYLICMPTFSIWSMISFSNEVYQTCKCLWC